MTKEYRDQMGKTVIEHDAPTPRESTAMKRLEDVVSVLCECAGISAHLLARLRGARPCDAGPAAKLGPPEKRPEGGLVDDLYVRADTLDKYAGDIRANLNDVTYEMARISDTPS